MTPTFPFKLGKVCPSGSLKLNECRRVEKKRKSSILARTSPRHMRRPTPNGMKNSGFCTFPSALMKRVGLNSSGLSQSVGSI